MGYCGSSREIRIYDTSWNLLLGNFVEGEDFVAAGRLRLLDPTGAVANAVALHRGIECYGGPSKIRVWQEIPRRVPRFGYKHCTIDLLVLDVLYIVHCALPNHENDSVPIRVRIVGKRAGNQQEPVSIVAPIADV